MNNYKELVSRIVYCASADTCDGCPLDSEDISEICVDRLLKKAADVIEQLCTDVARVEAENYAKEQYISETIGKLARDRKRDDEIIASLQKELVEAAKERDAAISDLRYQSACWNCTKNGKDCHANMPMEQPNVMCNDFEWRGAKMDEVSDGE